MTLDPYLQLLMLASAFLCGLLWGVLWDAGKILRVVLLCHTPPAFMGARYRRPLPLLGIGVPFRSEQGIHRVWRAIVIFTGDVLWCLAGAVASELLLFRFNDGAFRVGVPLLLLAGMGLWRCTFSRFLSYLTAWLAFFVGAAVMYLRALLMLPFSVLRFLLLRLLVAPLRSLFARRRTARKAQRSKALCALQLRLAMAGFENSQKTGGTAPLRIKRRRKNDEQKAG